MGKWVFFPLPMDVNWTTAAFTSKMPGMSSGLSLNKQRKHWGPGTLRTWSMRGPRCTQETQKMRCWRERESQAAPRPQMRMEKSDLSGSCRPSCCQTDQRWIIQPSPFWIPDPQHHEWHDIVVLKSQKSGITFFRARDKVNTPLNRLKNVTYHSKLMDSL